MGHQIAEPDGILYFSAQRRIRLGELLGAQSGQKRIVHRLSRVHFFKDHAVGIDVVELSEIHFDESGRLVVYTTAFPVALKMGWGEWDAKLKRLDRVLALWKGNEERLASLDLSFNDQVVARLRKVQGLQGARVQR